MEQLKIKTEKKELFSCAFTGHRELEEDFPILKLKKEVESLIKQGVSLFYNGMAKGFDLLSAEIVLKFKKKYPHIKMVACVPCYGQEKNFSKDDKERYVKILKKADETVTLSDYYFRGCMQVRDQYMVDRADILIAYCKKTTGGAAYTVGYCKKKYKDKEIIYI